MSQQHRMAIMWLVAALIFFLAVWLCSGASRKVKFPHQGAGAEDLIARDPPPSAYSMLPKIVVRPIEFHFAATAIDENGLESDYSQECVYTRTSPTNFSVTLAWDPSPSTNVIVNYKIYRGTKSNTYTASFNAWTNLVMTVPLFPPAPSNQVVHVWTSGATNIQYRNMLSSPWQLLNTTNWTATNPPPIRFFRAMARKNRPSILITNWWF